MLEFLFGLSPGLLVAAIIFAFLSLVSQMSLYAKAGQPAIAALVPVWNVMVFCKVVGRPAKHAWFLIIPGIVIMGIAAAYWPLLDGLFPVHCQGEWCPGPTSFSDAKVPFALMGVAAIPLAYFVIVMFTEICDSFGKHSMTDKVLCIIFNGFYILFVLGISTAVYESPWWARKRGKPYYMPDFKHKGKKYLVTPDGPLKGDYRKQKMKVAIVDEKIAAKLDPEKAVKEDLTKLAETVQSTSEKVEEVKKDVSSEKAKVADKKTEVSSASKDKKETPAKTESKPKPAAKSNDGAPQKSWREEMAEKYKKK